MQFSRLLSLLIPRDGNWTPAYFFPSNATTTVLLFDGKIEALIPPGVGGRSGCSGVWGKALVDACFPPFTSPSFNASLSQLPSQDTTGRLSLT